MMDSLQRILGKSLGSVLGLAGVMCAAAIHLSAQEIQEKEEQPKPAAETPAGEAKADAEKKDASVETLLQQASVFLAQGKLFDASPYILEALEKEPDNLMALNLQGGMYVRLRQYDQAIAVFKKLKELVPESQEARFNITELNFVQGKFEESLKEFEGIIKDNVKLSTSMKHLIYYKMLICYVKLDRLKEAEELLSKQFGYHDETPAFYYSKAVLALNQKNEAEAQEWLDAASAIYTPEQNTLYADSLIELGMIPSMLSPIDKVSE